MIVVKSVRTSAHKRTEVRMFGALNSLGLATAALTLVNACDTKSNKQAPTKSSNRANESRIQSEIKLADKLQMLIDEASKSGKLHITGEYDYLDTETPLALKGLGHLGYKVRWWEDCANMCMCYTVDW